MFVVVSQNNNTLLNFSEGGGIPSPDFAYNDIIVTIIIMIIKF